MTRKKKALTLKVLKKFFKRVKKVDDVNELKTIIKNTEKEIEEKVENV